MTSNAPIVMYTHYANDPLSGTCEQIFFIILCSTSICFFSLTERNFLVLISFKRTSDCRT